jgi:hypothetical protein
MQGHKAEEMEPAIHKELDKMKTTDVSDAELERFKARARADLLRSLGDNATLANILADYQTRYGDWREMFRELDKINAVSKADIRRVAQQTFVDSNRTTARIEFAPPQPPSPRVEPSAPPATKEPATTPLPPPSPTPEQPSQPKAAEPTTPTKPATPPPANTRPTNPPTAPQGPAGNGGAQ